MLALALTALLTLPATADETWVADFDRGVELAREAKKDLLVDFTGTDWCRWCVQLKAEVFRQEEFLAYARERYVLVSLDYPHDENVKAQVPNLARNLEVAAKYRVAKYPTVLLMTVDGDVFGQAGYQEGGPVKFVETLEQQRAKNRAPLVEAVKIARAFEVAEGAARAALGERAVALLESVPASSPAVRRLIPAVASTLESDPKNEQGLLGRALKAALPTGLATPAMIERARELDPKNGAGLLELALVADVYNVENERQVRAVCRAIAELDALGPVRDPEAARVLYSNGAIWTLRFLRDPAAAKKLARKALPFVQQDPQLRAKILQVLNG